jgi:hypothetical protein
VNTHICPWPVGVLLFNKPGDTERTLESLRNQIVAPPDDEILFSIDGYSGSKDEWLGRLDRTADVFDLIRKYFPTSQIVQHSNNLGIAKHFAFIEQQLFDRPNSEWAIFLEDDFVLLPNYLDVLSQLITFVESETEVVLVSATGDTIVEKTRGLDALYPMNHAWAFALRRTHWKERNAIMDVYLKMVRDVSYFERDTEKIMGQLAQLGLIAISSSQDYVKQAIRRRDGKLAITTGHNFGSYVGQYGEHFTPEVFESLGYGQVVPKAPDQWSAVVFPSIKDQLRLIGQEDQVAFAVEFQDIHLRRLAEKAKSIIETQTQLAELRISLSTTEDQLRKKTAELDHNATQLSILNNDLSEKLRQIQDQQDRLKELRKEKNQLSRDLAHL